MEYNEIFMCMDVKLDIHCKLSDSMKFKVWRKCQVKIEAIKCLPCFLRITLSTVPEDDKEEVTQLSVSINLPGVTISLANSRTKQHSYVLFWTHNRRNCFIYFAFDTALGCRSHMKWVRKSIKNLELYRQVFLEERRNSRGNGFIGEVNKLADIHKKMELRPIKDSPFALGPLPEIPDASNSINWSGRVSQASEIYEEIYEEHTPRLSRRLSRASISSGIYEEMKLYSPHKESIVENPVNEPPPLPPFRKQRKRLNTFISDPFGIFGEIPRSNTNPESDFVNKKTFKDVFDNNIYTGESKRSEGVSDTLINTNANAIMKSKFTCIKTCERNSFSSPDLSKINLWDCFGEEKLVASMILNSSIELDVHIVDDLNCKDLTPAYNYSSHSLNETTLAHISRAAASRTEAFKSRSRSIETLNISSQLPQNFNFSACNSSIVNLVGSNCAVPSLKNIERNEIVLEDELSGYCIMAPISNKKLEKLDIKEVATTTATSSTTSSTTSGYSTGSFCSSTSSPSSNSQAAESKDQPSEISQMKKNLTAAAIYDELPFRETPLPVAQFELNSIYVNLQTCSPINASNTNFRHTEIATTSHKDFTGSLYENLLTIKAAQELEQPLPSNLFTSIPFDLQDDKHAATDTHKQENIYQTPRKSIKSVDDKIPSYYPNNCDAVKMRRQTNSFSKHATSITIKSPKKEETNRSFMGLKNLVDTKIQCERKENFYVSPPKKILEQRKKTSTNSCPPGRNITKSKKSANAQKISDNVYSVNFSNKKSLRLYNDNDNCNAKKSPCEEKLATDKLKDKLCNELLQLALLQKIDFKFDDTSTTNTHSRVTASAISNDSKMLTNSGIAKLEQAELEYENCYQASKNATRLLQKYATLAPNQSIRIKQQLQNHQEFNQSPNQKTLMTQSTNLESPVAASPNITGASEGMSSKKFASLPRFKKIDFSPLKLKINNVLQRNQGPNL